MAYPDFITKAPDYVDMFMGVRKGLNDISAQNATVQTARDAQATREWLAQIDQEKANSEIALAPQKQALEEAKYKHDIVDDEAKNKLEASKVDVSRATQTHLNLMRDLELEEKKKEIEDAGIVNEFTDHMSSLDPDSPDFREKAGSLLTDYSGKLTARKSDPGKVYNAYQKIATLHPTFSVKLGELVEREQKFSPQAKEEFKIAVKLNGGDVRAAMDIGRLKTKSDLLDLEAKKQLELSKARTEGKGGMNEVQTRTMAAHERNLDAALKDDNKYNGLDAGTKLQVRAQVLQELQQSVLEDRTVDPAALADRVRQLMNQKKPLDPDEKKQADGFYHDVGK